MFDLEIIRDISDPRPDARYTLPDELMGLACDVKGIAAENVRLREQVATEAGLRSRAERDAEQLRRDLDVLTESARFACEAAGVQFLAQVPEAVRRLQDGLAAAVRLDTLREVVQQVDESSLHDCCYYTADEFCAWLASQIPGATSSGGSDPQMTLPPPRVGEDPRYDRGYEAGYQDGESSRFADVMCAVDEWPDYAPGELRDLLTEFLDRQTAPLRAQLADLRSTVAMLRAQAQEFRGDAS